MTIEPKRRRDDIRPGMSWAQLLRRRMTGANIAAFIATLLSGIAVAVTFQNVMDIQTGRRNASGITCAAISAVSEQGRLLVVNSAEAPTPPELELFLRKYGYPTPAQREKAAKAIGQAYVQGIAKAVQNEIGPRGSSVVRPDGTLDCTQVAKVARIPGGR